MIEWGKRPVLLIGHGLRRAGPEACERLLHLGVPVLSSWQAADLLDNYHSNYFGRPGVYGQRTANKILVEADHVVAVGNRLSIWNVGYEGVKQRLTIVDIDEREAKERYPDAEIIVAEAGEWIKTLTEANRTDWQAKCLGWRTPWLERSITATPAHRHGEYLNSYQLIHDIGKRMADDAVVVTDMGVALCGAFQVLMVRPPQRLLTSGGLGEMGCGLPYAVGSAFAGAKQVIALLTDGGMMLNLQEWQTVKHHELPIKMFIFDNRGYAMIRHTQSNLGYAHRGIDSASGVSMPSFFRLAQAFGFNSHYVRTAEEWHDALPQVMEAKGPVVCLIDIDPDQRMWPKLEPIVEDGKVRSPNFEELTPLWPL